LICDLCGPDCHCYVLARKLQQDRIQEAVQAKLERIRVWLRDEANSWVYGSRIHPSDKNWSNACWAAYFSIMQARKEAHNEWRGLKDSWL